ncbi:MULTISPECIES: Tm-1-like ATP-binding domain-containing protein [Thermus]|uniref:Uncharacterized protein n=1 Tax=Thermus scotoductus TaxID=37636 RepID=A0A430RT25_THESC|nr:MULTISPECIES: Tm-1-like ATP-binding domain-containing protein [Thermus]RTG92648.1 hypothetical protein CSW51_10640 [Thermus scotoductus]RTH22626.1 hypothetical protein CSW38_12855 [Thermus scotoductus]BCZ90552.1 hypothetical protein TthAA22_23570 [Thermus thermophilus]
MEVGLAVVATLDTKGPEARYLGDILEELGARAYLVDVGIAGDPPFRPDVGREEVAAEAGLDLNALSTLPRAEALAAMGRGAGRILLRLWTAGRIRGALALGGNQGSVAGGLALQHLPLGVPKVLLSTVASGNIRPFIGARDIWVLFTLADFLGGPNALSRQILRRGAEVLRCLVQGFGVLEPPADSGRTVALSALGNTTPLVEACREALQRKGLEAVVFHASGAGGTALEELVRAGWFGGVLDLTPHELVGEALGHDAYAPIQPGRLEGAVARAVPLVVSTGGLDYYVFGPPETVPVHLRTRPMVLHNPSNANVALSTEEFAEVAGLLCRRLNAARGPVALVVPLRGFSQYGAEGGPFYNPDGLRLFLETVREQLRPDIPLRLVDAPINHPAVAKAVLEEFERIRGEGMKDARR